MDKYEKYLKKAEEYLQDVKSGFNNFEPNQSFYLLQESVKNFLKAVLSFYEVEFPADTSIEEYIDTLEAKTTIKLPPVKYILMELDYAYCEGGCSTQVFYEKLPNEYIQPVEDLKFFIQQEVY